MGILVVVKRREIKTAKHNTARKTTKAFGNQCVGPEAGYPEDVLAEVLVAAVVVELGREIGAC